MSRLALSAAMLAALVAAPAIGATDDLGGNLPRRVRETDDPPKIKTADNKAGSKYRNRKKRSKPLFHV